MLKVAIDVGPVAEGSSEYGMGKYVSELLKALKLESRSKSEIEQIDARQADLAKYDIVHFTKFRPFFLSLPFGKPKGTKFALTIYDLIPLIYPKHYPPGVRGWIKWQINKFLIKKNIDAIITISETSKKDICRFVGVEPNRVIVTYLASPEEYKPLRDDKSLQDVRRRYKLAEKYALCDADVYYSKNIPNLVKACKLVKIPLVLVGAGAKTLEYAKQTNFSHPELSHLKNVNWEDVTALVNVPLGDLVKIYNLASVYIQPSFYEGFGIPLLQALACHVPVVVAKTQCLVEVLGSGFKYVDPNSPESIAQGITNPNRGVKPVRNYSWQKTAKDTLGIYEQV